MADTIRHLIPIGILTCIFGAFLTWLVTTHLTLGQAAIHYRSLLVTRDMLILEIASAKFVIGFGAYQPYQRIVIPMRTMPEAREIVPNAGLFDRGAARRWVETLNSRLAATD
jgi:hypothetical protein